MRLRPAPLPAKLFARNAFSYNAFSGAILWEGTIELEGLIVQALATIIRTNLAGCRHVDGGDFWFYRY